MSSPKLPSRQWLRAALKDRRLSGLTCVLLARQKLAAKKSVTSVLATLAVDADKIRPLSPTLYAAIANSAATKRGKSAVFPADEDLPRTDPPPPTLPTTDSRDEIDLGEYSSSAGYGGWGHDE